MGGVSPDSFSANKQVSCCEICLFRTVDLWSGTQFISDPGRFSTERITQGNKS
jgi:hypothetical protein